MRRRPGLGARRAAIGATIAAFASVATVGATGCGAPDTVVARVMEAGPPAVEAGAPCTESSQCGPQEVVDGGPLPMFCSMASCAAKTGTCQPRPTACDQSFVPTCDCEPGLLYWNDCLRKARGVSASQSNLASCTTVQTCSFDQDGGACPSGAYCAQFYDPMCDPPSNARTDTGLCWAVPDACPPTQTIGPVAVPPLVMSCGKHICMNFCAALVAKAPIASMACQ